MHLATLRGAGAATVGRELATALTRSARNSLVMWVPDQWRDRIEARSSHVDVRVSSRRGISGKLYIENIVIRNAVRRGEVDRLFSVGDTGPPRCGAPHLLLVQQAFLAYPPSEWGVRDRRFRLKMAAMAAYFRLGLRTVSHFTVQTETMRQRLSERWGIPLQDITVVPSSVSSSFLRNMAAPLQAEGQSAPYVCYVGSPLPHKNVDILADALAETRRSGIRLQCHLTVTADSVPRLAARAAGLGVLHDLVFRGTLEPDAVRSMLAGAMALVVPSRLESFGLPFHEAMAAGCPVIAADRDFSREACGAAALYADPDSAIDIAEKISLLSSSPALREALGQAGRSRFAHSHRSWADIAALYGELLGELR